MSQFMVDEICVPNNDIIRDILPTEVTDADLNCRLVHDYSPLTKDYTTVQVIYSADDGNEYDITAGVDPDYIDSVIQDARDDDRSLDDTRPDVDD